MTTEEATIEFLRTKIKSMVDLIATHDLSTNHWVWNGSTVVQIDRYTHLRSELLKIIGEALGRQPPNAYLYQFNFEETKNDS